jgi:glutamine---fructose-6-phosphate transaminase (isomerizing)
MCGIIGYIGSQEAVPILLQGLSRLEYRGYDSAGIGIINTNLHVVKQTGNIEELTKKVLPQSIRGVQGIAHTRWATHGAPTENNAHPHTDCTSRIVIVHNGIIENFQVLKELLLKEKHVFLSETDSEVIAHLIEKFYQGSIEQAVMHAVALLDGTFGITVMHELEQKIVVVRKGAPLIIGIADHGMLVSSDAAALLDHTNRVIYLRDGEMAVLTPKGYTITNFNGDKIKNDVQLIQWNLEKIEKAGFKHFMLKEIFEQPESVANTLRGRIKNDKVKLTITVPNSIRRIILLGCGTSWHAALIGKYLIESLTRIPVEVDYASEFRYRNPLITEEDLIVVISQSGETADTLAALRQSRNVTSLGIINVVGSTIAREVTSGIYLHAGPEIGVASTKAFTSQVTALLLLALHLQQRTGSANRDLLHDLAHLPQQIAKVLQQADAIKEIAQKFTHVRNFLYLGRGVNFPVALEGALKLKEISYIHAEGYPAAEMKHGPIALIDENMPAVFIAPHDRLFEKVLSNMQEIKARKGTIITITDQNDSRLEKLSDHTIIIPSVREELLPLITVIPLQLLAYYLADFKGLNVDKPRNLAKSVTVE